MKFFFCIFLLCFLSGDKCFSQDSITHVFHLDKLPPEGILLDKGWKFQAGDNADYAKPEYDDSKWQSVNPIIDIHDLPQILKSRICWFRLHLSIDSTVLNNQLALLIQQSGASEIYLNGQLIHHFGILSVDPKEIKAYDPLGKPVSFAIGKNAQQVLAVRYAIQPDVRYTTIWGSQNPGLKIKINNIVTSSDHYHQTLSDLKSLNLFQTGVFFILAILHLAFYLFYPTQKANLYFAYTQY
jgi:hypothetical protein